MKKIFLALVGLVFPVAVFAQGQIDIEGNRLVEFMQDIIIFIDDVLVPFVFAIAFIVFLWGVFQYFIAGGGDEEKRDKGKKFVAWGIVGFFVMVSVWGIVNLFTNTFGFNNEIRPALPSFNGTRSEQQPQNPYTDGCPPGEVPYGSGCIPAGQ